MKTALTGIRDLRAKYAVPPSARLEARIKAPAATARILEALRAHLEGQGGLSSLTIAQQVERPKNAATSVVADMELFLADVLDPVKEKGRLGKEKEKVEKNLAALETKLGNPKFLEKAKPELVAEERRKQDALRAQLASIEVALEEL
jgi:valyl-tRNA synthetase